MSAPAGAPTRLKVSVLAGMSESVAVAVKLSKLFTFTDWLPIGSSTGAVFPPPTVLTVTVIASSSHNGMVASSQTLTVNGKEPTEEGVQLNTPKEVMSAPAGAPTRLKVSVLAGMSESVAVAVKLSKLLTSTDWFPIGFSTGAVFPSPTALTVTVIASSSHNWVIGAVTMSQTLTVKG